MCAVTHSFHPHSPHSSAHQTQEPFKARCKELPPPLLLCSQLTSRRLPSTCQWRPWRRRELLLLLLLLLCFTAAHQLPCEFVPEGKAHIADLVVGVCTHIQQSLNRRQHLQQE